MAVTNSPADPFSEDSPAESSASPTGTAPFTATPAPQPVAPDAPEKRSVVTTVLMLVVTLLLGIVIGLLLDRTLLSSGDPAEPDPPEEVVTYPEAPPAEVVELMNEQALRNEGDPLAMGAVDAPIMIIEYADLRCSYCGKWGLETKPELQEYFDQGLVRLEWRDFPVFQEESVDLAVAARAAGEQGLFWEMSHEIMAYQFERGGADFSEESLVELAGTVGVPDLETFRARLGADDLRALVDADYETSLQLLGRPATPQFLVGQQHVGGFLDTTDFTLVIEQELQRHRDLNGS